MDNVAISKIERSRPITIESSLEHVSKIVVSSVHLSETCAKSQRLAAKNEMAAQVGGDADSLDKRRWLEPIIELM